MKKLSVILLALVMAFAWTASAFAEATPYASVRFQTFYQSVDNGASTDRTDLKFGVYESSTTRFGVKFKVSDEVSGLFEVNNGVGLRHAFGVYKFGAGELLIGHTWSPYAFFSKDIYDDTAGLRYGSGALRLPQVKMTFKPGVYVALLASGLDATDDEFDFPELAVGYKGKFGDVAVGVHGAYVTADYTAGGDEESWLLKADVVAKVAGIEIAGLAFYGDDVNNMMNGQFRLLGGATSGDLNSYGVQGSVTFYPSDKIAVTVGAAYIETEATAGDDDNSLLVYANAPIKVTKGLTIVPEIAYQDALDVNGVSDATSTISTAENALWVGAKWQFDL